MATADEFDNVDKHFARLVEWVHDGENRNIEIGGDQPLGGPGMVWVVVEWLAETFPGDLARNRCDEMIARYVSYGDTLSEALEQAVRDLPPEPNEDD